MRQAGQIADAQQARRLADYLLSLGVRSKVEPGDGGWTVWIFNEEEVPRGKAELAQFLENPDDPRYAQAASAAARARRDEDRRNKEFQKNFIQVRDRWQPRSPRRALITWMLIGLSIGVSIATDFGDNLDPWGSRLFIAAPRPPVVDEHGRHWPLEGLLEIRRGEAWRLVTPILLHFKVRGIPFLHLFFNMYWLNLLGGTIEARRGSIRLLLLILAIAVTSNLCQYYWEGPSFGGMSGVNFGLFGYVWMKSRLDPASGFYVDSGTVVVMVGWFLLCLTGSFGPVANIVHGVGLAVGMAIGSLPILWRR